jgi:hypothetical protein
MEHSAHLSAARTTSASRRGPLVAASLVAMLVVTAVGFVDAAHVAEEENRNAGGWLQGWGTIFGVVIVVVVSVPLLIALVGATLTRRSPVAAGWCILVAGFGGALVGLFSLAVSVPAGLVALPAVVVCALAFAALTSPVREGDTFAG